MSLIKRQITQNLKKAHSTTADITKLKENTDMIISGMIRTGVGHVELAKSENKNLETATNVLVTMLEKVVILKPGLNAECITRVEKADKELEEYAEKVSECITETAIKFESTPGTGSMPGSRETNPSRAQRRFVNVRHLLPETLG